MAKYRTGEQKSKVYGDKVLDKVGSAPIMIWAMREINSHGYKTHNDSKYRGTVTRADGQKKYIDGMPIISVNGSLTPLERRQIFDDLEKRLGYSAEARDVEARLEAERKDKKRTGKGKAREGYNAEEAMILDTLSRKDLTVKDVTKHKVTFESLPYEVKYLLAKREFVRQFVAQNELLKDYDARVEQRQQAERLRERELRSRGPAPSTKPENLQRTGIEEVRKIMGGGRPQEPGEE